MISYTSIETREQLSGFLLAFLHSDSIELGYNVQSSLENKKFFKPRSGNFLPLNLFLVRPLMKLKLLESWNCDTDHYCVPVSTSVFRKYEQKSLIFRLVTSMWKWSHVNKINRDVVYPKILLLQFWTYSAN